MAARNKPVDPPGQAKKELWAAIEASPAAEPQVWVFQEEADAVAFALPRRGQNMHWHVVKAG
jgi:hypothetical protein